MYKSRLWIWLILFIFIAGGTNLYPIAKESFNKWQQEQANKPEKVKKPKTVSVSSFDVPLRQRINDKKINGTKLLVTSSEADIIINEGVNEQEGYLSETLYTPIVAILRGEKADSLFKDIGGANRYVRVMNLAEVLKGFAADQKFKDFYSYSTSGKLAKEIPDLWVDTHYEKEIKTTMIMALSGKSNITQKDVDAYSDFINRVWDKANKTDDVDSLLAGNIENKIIITTEQKMYLNDNNQPLSFSNTVAVKYTVNYKENLDYIIYDEKFISETVLRREGIVPYTKNLFANTDWTISYLYNDAIDFELKESAEAPPNETETTVLATIINDSVKTEPDIDTLFNFEGILRNPSETNPECDTYTLDWSNSNKNNNGQCESSENIEETEKTEAELEEDDEVILGTIFLLTFCFSMASLIASTVLRMINRRY